MRGHFAIRIGLGGLVETGEVLGNGSGLALLLGPVQLNRRLAVVAAGVSLGHAGIDGEPLALDESDRDRRPDDPREDMA